MNQINNDELFGNLKNFLKTKGIELQEGPYAQRIQRGCGILTDSINVSQRTLQRAKSAMDKGLDQLRQTIHEQTAPKSAAAEGAPPKQRPAKPAPAAGKASAAPRKSRKSGRGSGKN